MDLRTFTDCLYFVNGNCVFNEKCLYRHCHAAVQQLEKCINWPRSCRDVNCPKRHPAPPKKTNIQQKSGKNLVVFFWNIESVPIPRGVKAFEIVQNIRKKLVTEADSQEVAFYSFCNVTYLSSESQQSLNHATVNMIHVPSQKNGSVQLKIMNELSHFGRLYHPPATIVLISDDIDFVSKLSELRHQIGFNIIVIHHKPVSDELHLIVNHFYPLKMFTGSAQQTEVSANNASKRSQSQQGRSQVAQPDQLSFDTYIPIPKLRTSRSRTRIDSENESNSGHARHSSQKPPTAYSHQSRSRRRSHAKSRPPSGQRPTLETQNQAPEYWDASRIPTNATTPMIMSRFCVRSDTNTNSVHRITSYTPATFQQTTTTANNDDTEDQQLAKSFSCAYCTNQFKTMQALRQHQNDKKHMFYCSVCDCGFPTNHSLRQHKSAKGHENPPAALNWKKPRSASFDRMKLGWHDSQS